MSGARLWLVTRFWLASPLLATGCLSTSMGASFARVPVLVGPVACIGCEAGAVAPDPTETRTIEDVANLHSTTVMLFGTATTTLGGDAPELDLKATDLLADRCREEIQLSAIKASSFGINAFVVYRTDVDVEVKGHARRLAHGFCAPNPWPVSTSKEIVFETPTPPADLAVSPALPGSQPAPPSQPQPPGSSESPPASTAETKVASP